MTSLGDQGGMHSHSHPTSSYDNQEFGHYQPTPVKPRYVMPVAVPCVNLGLTKFWGCPHAKSGSSEGTRFAKRHFCDLLVHRQPNRVRWLLVHCKNNMVVLTHIRSTQFHGTTECTVKCISVRSLYSGKPSYSLLLSPPQKHDVYIVFLWWG